jgi:hypothetical protein
MTIIASIVALNLAVAFATPVVAAEIPTTKAQCEQAGMRWKESANQDKCRFAKARNFFRPSTYCPWHYRAWLDSSRSHNSLPGMAQRQRA